MDKQEAKKSPYLNSSQTIITRITRQKTICNSVPFPQAGSLRLVGIRTSIANDLPVDIAHERCAAHPNKVIYPLISQFLRPCSKFCKWSDRSHETSSSVPSSHPVQCLFFPPDDGGDHQKLGVQLISQKTSPEDRTEDDRGARNTKKKTILPSAGLSSHHYSITCNIFLLSFFLFHSLRMHLMSEEMIWIGAHAISHAMLYRNNATIMKLQEPGSVQTCPQVKLDESEILLRSP